jgi:hypothetical protein
MNHNGVNWSMELAYTRGHWGVNSWFNWSAKHE